MGESPDLLPIKIGTCGYSYPGPPPKGWFGAFYPQTKGKRLDPLEYYSQFFDTVEINSSFYGPPNSAMANAWVRKTPADFEFSIKAWQKFTHTGKIGQGGATGDWEPTTQADIDLFKTGIQPLAESGKLGVLLFQYPPSFHFTEQNEEALRSTLKAFAEYPKVVELRDKSWTDRSKETTALMEELGVSWVLIDEPKFGSSVRQEFSPIGDIFYYRLHGRNYAKWWEHGESWERYDYLYNREEIRQAVNEVQKAMQTFPGSKAYVFFNNHARGQSAANAIMMSQELKLPIKAAPPETLARAFPQIAELVPKPSQESLF